MTIQGKWPLHKIINDDKILNKAGESGIFYIDNLVTKFGNQVLTWKQFRHLKNKPTQGRIPSWYKSLYNIIADGEGFTKDQFTIDSTNHASFSIDLLSTNRDKRIKEWIIIPDSERVIIGKINNKNNDDF